jgi:hypothetical protein
MIDFSHTTTASSDSIKSLISSTHSTIASQSTHISSSSSSDAQKHKTSLSIHTNASTEPILGAVSTTPILPVKPEPTDTTNLIDTSYAPAPQKTAKPKDASSWRDKLHIHSKPEVPGKEKWRDATLNEKERWKEWQKAKDREQAAGSTIGFYTEFYKGKGKSGYWLDFGW